MHAMSLVWVSELPPAPPPQVLQDSSPLLFVECSEHNGRAPRQTQTLRKRHIMRTSKNSARRDAVPAEERRTDIKTHVLDGPVARTSTNGSAVSATAKQNRPSTDPRLYIRHAGTDVCHAHWSNPRLQSLSCVTYGPSFSVSPFASIGDVAAVWRWFFYGHDVGGRGSFNVARWHFMETTWDKGRDHEMSVSFGGV